MIVSAYIKGNINTEQAINKNTEIVYEENKTLSSFLLKVNDKNAHIVITVASELGEELKFDIKSVEDLYNTGVFQIPLKWRPWVHTYDDTNNVYIIMFEPDYPIRFSKFSVVIYTNSEVKYSYEAVFIK